MRSYGFMLCGRFYMPLLLVTVARGSKVPGAACSPFQSAPTNNFEMEDNYDDYQPETVLPLYD